MKISKLLDLDRQNADPLALKKNFGDSFLVKKNRIFRNIRIAVSEYGFEFSNNATADFLALPFSQLETMLTNKTIPYVDNVTVLEKITKQTKDQVTWDDISDGFRRNYVFHESCHGVIRSLAKSIFQNRDDLSTLKGQPGKCLHILLEESFANTCELLAAVYAKDENHKIFYELGSYTSLFESRNFLMLAIDSLGEKFVFKFFMLIYLHSNFLVQQLSDKQFEAIIRLAGDATIDAKNLKNLKALAKIPFTLDLRFRTTTTALHLRLNGLDKVSNENIGFNFMEIIKNETGYLELLDSVCSIALK